LGCEPDICGGWEAIRDFASGRRRPDVDERRRWEQRVYESLTQLPAEDQQRFRLLQNRCQGILETQTRGAPVPPGLQEQGEGLGRLVWIYLRLLLTRESIRKIVRESAKTPEDTQMETRIQKIEAQLKEPSMGEDLRKSLAGQVEILKQRQEKKREAGEKLVFLDAELTRIEQQVELLREQAVLSTDPEVVSQRIEQVAATLGGTNQWIRDHRRFTAPWKIFLPILHLLSFPDRRNPNEPAIARMGQQMRDLSNPIGTSSTAISDVVPADSSGRRLPSLKAFLESVMFDGDIVLEHTAAADRLPGRR
jgi:hypothetical protein